MSQILITEQYLINIANAIRQKLNTQDLFFPSEMAQAISSFSTTSGVKPSELIENPEYFYSECVDTVRKIDALRSDKSFIIYFITDSHVYTSSDNLKYLDAQLASMYAISKMIKPDLVVHGGDMTNGSEAKEITVSFTDHIVNCIKEIGGDDSLILIGNHDGNTVQSSLNNEQQRITEQEMLEMYRSWDDGFTYAGSNYQGGNFYGYRDYSEINLRIIRLHSYKENIGVDGYYGGQGQNWGYYTDQITWFQNVALNTDNTILILCHQSLSPILQGYAESQDIPHGGMQLQQAIDNWLAANSAHRCAGVVHGHVHWDFSHKGKGTFNVIDHSTKQIVTRNGSYGDFYEHGQCLSNYLTTFGSVDSTPTSSYRDIPEGAIVRGRSAGQASQGLWTAIVVDTEKEKISFIRFGAGEDKSFGYGVTKYYTITTNLTGATLSNSITSIGEDETYVSSVILQDDYSIDNIVILMGDNDITNNVYNNGTITINNITDDITITVVASKPKINLLLTALDSDKESIYPTITHPTLTTVGYAAGYRLGSSGTESAATGKYVTGYIPVKAGDKIVFENMTINGTTQDNNYITFYDSSLKMIYSRYAYTWIAQTGNVVAPFVNNNGNISSITLTGGIHSGTTYSFNNVAYIRIACNNISDNSNIYIQ